MRGSRTRSLKGPRAFRPFLASGLRTSRASADQRPLPTIRRNSEPRSRRRKNKRPRRSTLCAGTSRQLVPSTRHRPKRPQRIGSREPVKSGDGPGGRGGPPHLFIGRFPLRGGRLPGLARRIRDQNPKSRMSGLPRAPPLSPPPATRAPPAWPPAWHCWGTAGCAAGGMRGVAVNELGVRIDPLVGNPTPA